MRVLALCAARIRLELLEDARKPSWTEYLRWWQLSTRQRGQERRTVRSDKQKRARTIKNKQGLHTAQATVRSTVPRISYRAARL